MLSRTHKLILGIAILLLVDLIWVSSSELTKVISHNQHRPRHASHILAVFTDYLLYVILPHSFCTKMKTSTSPSSVRTSKRQCLHFICWFWDWLHRGRTHAKKLETVIRYLIHFPTCSTPFKVPDHIKWFFFS